MTPVSSSMRRVFLPVAVVLGVAAGVVVWKVVRPGARSGVPVTCATTFVFDHRAFAQRTGGERGAGALAGEMGTLQITPLAADASGSALLVTRNAQSVALQLDAAGLPSAVFLGADPSLDGIARAALAYHGAPPADGVPLPDGAIAVKTEGSELLLRFDAAGLAFARRVEARDGVVATDELQRRSMETLSTAAQAACAAANLEENLARDGRSRLDRPLAFLDPAGELPQRPQVDAEAVQREAELVVVALGEGEAALAALDELGKGTPSDGALRALVLKLQRVPADASNAAWRTAAIEVLRKPEHASRPVVQDFLRTLP